MKSGSPAPTGPAALGADGEAIIVFGDEGLHPALVELRRHTLARVGRTLPARPAPRLGYLRARRLAIAVSHGASPPVMVLLSAALVAAGLAGWSPWLWAAVHVVLAVLAPLAVLVAMLRRGEVRDLELTRRDQRGGPLMLTFLCTGFSLFVQATAGAPAPLVRLALAWTLLGGVLMLVTRWWKISVHAAAVAAAGALAWRLTGSPWGLLVGATTMGTARVFLDRHSVAQVVAGALAGAGVVILLIR